MTETPAATEKQRVECPATKDVTVTRLIIAAVLIGVGVWCLIDRGNYPQPVPWEMGKGMGYILNNFGPFVFIPAGLAAIAWGLAAMKRRLVADEEGIGYVGKQKVPWKEIKCLDASRLEEIQIVRLIHGQDEKVMRLDGVKLGNFRELLAFVETHVPSEATRK